MNKKPVYTSNLAVRFHKADGWDFETLSRYMKTGHLIDTEYSHGDDPNMAYYIFDVGSDVDVVKLYEEQIDRVVRGFNDYPTLNDLQFIEKYF